MSIFVEDTIQSLTLFRRIKTIIKEFDFDEGIDFVVKGNRLFIQSLLQDYFELKDKDFSLKEQILKTFISICKTHHSTSPKQFETPKNYVFYSECEKYIERWCEILSTKPKSVIEKYIYLLIVQFINELVKSKQLSLVSKIISYESLTIVFSLIQDEFKTSTIYIRNCFSIYNELSSYKLYEELNRIISSTFTLNFIQNVLLKQSTKDLYVFVSELLYDSIKNQSNGIIFSQNVNDFLQLVLDSLVKQHVEINSYLEFDEFSKSLNSITKTNGALVSVNFNCSPSVSDTSLIPPSRL
ncbi:hypothetical protein EHI8A_009600 [Entamoeba histolytica HM-1:IMSS-B]|uniref:Uncharacterized protein n=5 Tax=Entamoeba histolytica TaxID=5759 RepID=C4M8S7_ENTH1|nr:hypothetical protein EHI_146960 [Entamoeba histolytica HM-1:IMSS]EMH74130.1 hypothetical protein EHI8A_009600 [Entamoeba histolytica HM-1:IMSS-B]EMS14659.1 hypothetical protein KM1_029210 [Entamoeba histolytica HM-3:IMSS]ENY65229.1 hypothetical protein EHI7A_012890 [Entamoeba histolytica HM-1:IMSS-A]GAT98023.1 hypothetical protein CL6EHI_146960 [Entamoeba histolytica]EAL44331.1 hypothetical protein EHI_146960 [Entamoeba histolytica HM-1:IMSS]|eukprot:XP_649717.1 hypothetical protein EHI_146960 [Entamoeba histolytica HM-1:IMSS]